MPLPERHPAPRGTAEKLAQSFFGAGQSPAALRRAVRHWLAAALAALILVPALFYLRFGRLDGFGWGLTLFFVVFCLLTATGLYFLRKPAFHTSVPLRGDLLDRLGSLWLLACAFGPFFGWILTSAIPLTLSGWRWVYAARVILSIFLPVLTALALLRYVRGRGAWVMLLILLCVTALPIWSGWNTARDLLAGPRIQRDQLVLPYTARAIDTN